MTEYVVKWKHLRYPVQVDDWYYEWVIGGVSTQHAQLRIADCEMLPQHLYRSVTFYNENSPTDGDVYPSGHGGKTECHIYRSLAKIETVLQEVATAEAVCSWRDQFSRKTGRLYSLALALAEAQENPALWQLLAQQVPNLDDNTWELLSGYILLHDIPQIKSVCAAIVAEWRKPQHADYSDAIRSFYREAMRLCGTAPDNLEWLEYWADLLDASKMHWDELTTPILIGDRSEVVAICDKIVAEWRRSGHAKAKGLRDA